MTQEDKDLLLKDIYARIPYGVKGCFEGETFCTTPSHWYVENTLEFSVNYNVIKNGWRPYLFPLSSMTEEQCDELYAISELQLAFTPDRRIKVYKNTIEWFLKNHIDYDGLIEKSLALDATNLGIYE